MSRVLRALQLKLRESRPVASLPELHRGKRGTVHLKHVFMVVISPTAAENVTFSARQFLVNGQNVNEPTPHIFETHCKNPVHSIVNFPQVGGLVEGGIGKGQDVFFGIRVLGCPGIDIHALESNSIH